MSQGSVYERQVDQVLTGGWNLLPPGDLLERSEALQAENFRIDTAGNLTSRFGRGGAVWTPGDVRSLCQVKGIGVRRYAATYTEQLWRDGAQIDGGIFLGGGPIALSSYQNKLWAMNRNARMVDDGGGLLLWTVAAPAIAGGILIVPGSLTVGVTYTYFLTYALAGGADSLSSDGLQMPISAGFRSTEIISPVASADPRVIGWNLYRIGDTLEEALRLNTAPIPIGTPFFDTGGADDFLTDEQVTELGVILDPNTAGPPAGNGLAGPYYERLLAWGVFLHPNRLYWSGTRQPNNFPGSTLDEGNHADVGEFGEQLVGVTIRPRVAAIYKDSSIWRLVGDPGDLSGNLELVTDAIGAIGGQAIIQAGPMDYFQGPEGYYSFNGDRVQKITGKLDPLFRGLQPELAGFAFPTGIRLNQDPIAKQRNCAAHRNGRLYFFYCGGEGQLFPNRGITCELGADNWASDSRPVRAILDEGGAAVDETLAAPTGSGLLLGSVDGGVVSLEEGYEDDGTPIALAYHSAYRNQGAPDNNKTYADVVIEHNTGGAPLTVAAFYNNGTGVIPAKLLAAQEALGTIVSAVKTTSVFQCAQLTDKLGIQARNIAIRIEGDASPGLPAVIYKIAVHYFIEPRDSRTFDSDETDLGTERVKAINEIELDIDYPSLAGGRVLWTLYAQQANGVGIAPTWQVADNGNFGITNGREILRIPVAGGVEARLVRLALRADSDEFRLYGARLRVLPFGTYTNAYGEVFETVALNIGTQ